MAEAKTKPTGASVDAFLAAVEPPVRRADGQAALAFMRETTGLEPVMWGPSIIGFGRYHYVYASGQAGDWPLVGLSPRKANLVFYLAPYWDEAEDLFSRLGKHKRGKGCLYVNKLADIDLAVLAELVQRSMAHLRKTYPS